MKLGLTVKDVEETERDEISNFTQTILRTYLSKQPHIDIVKEFDKNFYTLEEREELHNSFETIKQITGFSNNKNTGISMMQRIDDFLEPINSIPAKKIVRNNPYNKQTENNISPKKYMNEKITNMKNTSLLVDKYNINKVILTENLSKSHKIEPLELLKQDLNLEGVFKTIFQDLDSAKAYFKKEAELYDGIRYFIAGITQNKKFSGKTESFIEHFEKHTSLKYDIIDSKINDLYTR
ncbi:MAG: hypothetical protein ACQESC_03000 [Nanobdellota archaeon]